MVAAKPTRTFGEVGKCEHPAMLASKHEYRNDLKPVGLKSSVSGETMRGYE